MEFSLPFTVYRLPFTEIFNYQLIVFCDEFFHPYHVEPLVELSAAFVEMGYLGVSVLGMEADGGLCFCCDAGTEIDDTLSSKTFFQFCIEGGADAATVGILVDIDRGLDTMVVGCTLAKTVDVAVANNLRLLAVGLWLLAVEFCDEVGVVLQDFLYSVAEFLNGGALQLVGYAGVLYVI